MRVMPLFPNVTHHHHHHLDVSKELGRCHDAMMASKATLMLLFRLQHVVSVCRETNLE
jgi:hypothetical protein